MKKLVALIIPCICFFFVISGCGSTSTPQATDKSVNVAVEYTSHAGAFYFAQGKNLFYDAGFDIRDVKVYASGVGVATAFTQGGFDVGYMCLVPAIFTYANGGVPIKIIAGTHKDGYGLVVNSAKIRNVKDLEKPGVKIANGPKGTVTDFLQMLLIEKEKLNSKAVLANTVRMNAAKQLMALRNGKVDAIFVPEHFASMAASYPGMKMLVDSRDIWPDMQGSVLVVTDGFLKNRPKDVAKLKKINQNGIALINQAPREAASIIAKKLNINQAMVKEEMKSLDIHLEVGEELVARSLNHLRNTPDIAKNDVQAVIDKMYALGYIPKAFDAAEIISGN
jgi:NitT/TauT family transport system substrate-binding protein